MQDGAITDTAQAPLADGPAAPPSLAPIWWPTGVRAASPGGPDSLRRTVAGTLFARPWFDRTSLFALRHVMFPASRLWAAAQVADGDLEQFLAAVPMAAPATGVHKLTRVLEDVARAKVAAKAMDAEWERVFFGEGETSALHRRAVEAARLAQSDLNNGTRWRLRATLRQTVPRAKLAIETPDAVEAIYGGGRSAFNALSAPPAVMPEVTVSRAFPTPFSRDFWLRFQSPSRRLGDMVYARVHEPANAENAPTIIFGHGVCVEFDHWKGLIDECEALVRRGFRVIRPEAPWHGRRAPNGLFGGERTIGAFPMGLIDSFAGALQEWSVIADWARRRSTGALVFGGSSLGAMTAQLAASRAADGPDRLRPDALFLVTHTGDMAAAVLDGALANMWASTTDVERQGWSRDMARAYLSLINPIDPMPIPGHRIVSILGRRDKVLPFESGRQLLERWKVPAANSFIWDRGHFSVPTTLIRNTAPLDRLAQVVERLP